MAFPLISAAIGAAGSIIGGMNERSAASRAAAQQRNIGKNTARRVTKAGKWGARASRQAADAQVEGLESAQGYLRPYSEAGGRGFSLYADLMGVNGPEAQAAAHGVYEASPGFQDSVDYGISQAEQSAVNRGNAFSGGTLSELTQVGQRMKLDDFYRWRDELEGLGDTGYNAANTMADYESQIGTAKAGGILGAANSRIGGFLQATNALAGGAQNASALNMYGSGQMNQGINNALSTLGGFLNSKGASGLRGMF